MDGAYEDCKVLARVILDSLVCVVVSSDDGVC